ncbi:MAG: type transport system permease protein [Thermoanaerobaculia bacterium]|jgi:ABC-2 type transport system permease protein|nr:type transport system permease protein [Thermoanaerobaculia bacterium]
MTDSLAPVAPSRVFAAILLRDLTVARRELPYFLVRTALQPILFVIVFGFLLPKMGMIPRGYSTTMLPGVVALSLTLSAIQSVALPMMQDFGFTKEIEDRLLSPVPIHLVAVEKVVAGVLQGIVAALFVLPVARLIMGPIPGLSFANAPLLLAVTVLGGAAFSAMGLYLGTGIAPQQIGLMFSVIVAPMIMFGCTYYPWAGLDHVPVMKWLVLINPLVYVSEGMRAALTPGLPHMPIALLLAALVVLTVIFMWMGLKAFDKRAMS